jgi:dUTP pyrophosphatase
VSFSKNGTLVSIMQLRVQKLTNTAKMPHFAHDTDAGMDMCADEEITIQAGERVQIKTGIAVAIPEGFVGLVWDKSGLSHRTGLKTLGGVIDAGYRGEILIGMVNLSDAPHTFSVGDKIAQMLIQKIEHPILEEVTTLDETTRGAGGFGSTGT